MLREGIAIMNMRPEEQLLLCCTRTKLSKDKGDEIRKLMNNGLDWDYVLQMGKAHGLAPLLYYHLYRIDYEHRIPQSIMERLRNIYYGNLVHNISLDSELNKILNTFEKEEIPVVVLRGLALAQIIYKNIALRSTIDIDLLVQKKDLSRVVRALLELKFTSPQAGLARKEYSAELCFVKRVICREKSLPTVYIDVHQDITSSIRLKRIIKTDTEGVIRRAHPTRIENVNMLAMAPEDLLLHLTLRHCFERLIRLCDIAEVIKAKKSELDWQFLLERTKESRITSIMYYTLWYAQQLLEAPVPEYVFKKLMPSWWRKSMLDVLLSKAVYPDDSNSLSRGRKYFLQILMVDGLIDVFLVLWTVMFPSSEWLAYYYGRPRAKKPYLSHFINLFAVLLSGIRDILRISFNSA